MKHYFGNISNSTLTFFGPIHITLMLLTFLIIIFIYKYRSILIKCKYIKNILALFQIVNLLIFIFGAVFTGNFDISIHLPLHYCYITGLMFAYSLLKEKKNWFNFLYYAIFFCTITVIIFKDPRISYDRYDFIHLIVNHHILLISSFYTLFVLNYRVDKRGYKYFVIYSVLVYFIVFIINKLIGTNYIFNDTFPSFIYEYFPFLNLAPPLIWLLLLSIPLLLIAYFPVRKINKNV